jgi:hypothetical protein
MAKQEPKVSFYDPTVNAFREISVERAKEYIKGMEDVKKQIAEIEGTETPKEETVPQE